MAELEKQLEMGTWQALLRSELARIGAAPTNWHQATIYFLTSTDEEDAQMRRRAPLMYVAGVILVVVQIISMYGVVMGMMAPPCINNVQCSAAGFYCEVARDGRSGRCQSCGGDAPMMPYEADTLLPGENAVSGFGINKHQEFNKIFYQSYPHREFGLKRSDIPDGFAGWNFTQVKNRCSEPIASFSYSVSGTSSGSPTLTDEVIITDRGDLPAGRRPTRSGSKYYSAKTVKNWCAACTRTLGPDDYLPDPLNDNGLALYDNETGLEVSVMNTKLQSILAVNAMAIPDWTALLLCSYVVGMTVLGEIKDTQLCTFSIARNAKELSVGWKIALELLGILRSHFFLLPLMGAIPCVVLTQGGSAMAICFNTIAILFRTSFLFSRVWVR